MFERLSNWEATSLGMSSQIYIQIALVFLHAEDTELLLGASSLTTQCNTERQTKNIASVRRIDDTVIPQTGGTIVRVALSLILVHNILSKCVFFSLRPVLTSTVQAPM